MNTDDEARLRERLRQLSPETPTPARHDAAILERAQRAAEKLRPAGSGVRSRPAPRRWALPLSLAASLLLGMLAMRIIDLTQLPHAAAGTALVIPANAARGAAGRDIPVEQAKADDWYRYIQELVAAGETREAERHLKRFNELHPDYVYQP
jgi:hypothetical protein